MEDLTAFQLIAIGLIFIWSGFVRSGLGFGGAALGLPLMLLVVNDPLLFLPLLCMHLLFFSCLILWQGHKERQTDQTTLNRIDWIYLRKAIGIMIIPKLIGVLGLVSLPATWVSGFIFVVIFFYAGSYLLNKPFVSRSSWLDYFFLILGGYVSGTSLIGAPLIIAVFSRYVARQQLRETLFVLWIVMVVIKLASLLALGVDMQWQHQIWILPCVYIGHRIGLLFHYRVQQASTTAFYRGLGAILILVSLVGLGQILLA